MSAGIPTFNDAREAYGFERVADFSEITTDVGIQKLLSAVYGGDVSLVDAYVGAVAEDQTDGTNLFVGPLLQVREAYTFGWFKYCAYFRVREYSADVSEPGFPFSPVRMVEPFVT